MIIREPCTAWFILAPLARMCTLVSESQKPGIQARDPRACTVYILPTSQVKKLRPTLHMAELLWSHS